MTKTVLEKFEKAFGMKSRVRVNAFGITCTSFPYEDINRVWMCIEEKLLHSMNEINEDFLRGRQEAKKTERRLLQRKHALQWAIEAFAVDGWIKEAAEKFFSDRENCIINLTTQELSDEHRAIGICDSDDRETVLKACRRVRYEEDMYKQVEALVDVALKSGCRRALIDTNLGFSNTLGERLCENGIVPFFAINVSNFLPEEKSSKNDFIRCAEFFPRN